MKKLLVILGVIVALGVAAYLFLSSSVLGDAVQAGVESYAPKLTGTPVTLESASVSPFNGAGQVKGLSVANPEGYSEQRAIYIGEVALDVDPWSLMSESIHIERIYVSEPEFNYERKLSGGNLDTILKNIQQATASEKPPTDEEGEPIKMIVDEVVIEGGRVSLSALGQGLVVPLPRLELRDIGKEEGGVTPAQAALEVMQVVLKEVIRVGVEALQSGSLKIGDAETSQTIQKAAGQAQDAAKALEGLFRKPAEKPKE